MTGPMTEDEQPTSFPFSAVVGQDDAKLALLLVSVDPLIGGVLLRGQKGSAKTTLARGLAAVHGEDTPFVDMPLGVSEDRLLGSIDIGAALGDGEVRFTPGLLHGAHGGVLYVDEVNLLADHLVDSLLDVSVSGHNRVEREGVSHSHASRFVLIGSMNPEEGELRPQLLDRFGLCVEVTAPTGVADRVEAVQRRLAFESGGTLSDPPPVATPAEGTRSTEPDRPSVLAEATERQLRSRLTQARPAAIDRTIIESAARLALEVGAEGLRADLVLCRAAAALAGLEDRGDTTVSDLRRVAPLVLAHRSRRHPFDPPTMNPDDLDDAVDQALGKVADPPPPGAREPSATAERPDDEPASDRGPSGADGRPESDTTTDPPADTPNGARSPDSPSTADATKPMTMGSIRSVPADARPTAAPARSPRRAAPAGSRGGGNRTESDRGRTIRDVAAQAGDARPIAIAASVRSLAARRRHDPSADPESGDLRHAVRQQHRGTLIVLAVDTSGSMGAPQRAEAATGTVLGLLTDAYQRRDHVALVTFREGEVQTALTPTGSIEVARNRLASLTTGGTTPLAAGLHEALTVATRRRAGDREAMIVLLSDGRATGSPDALDAALAAAAEVRAAGVTGLVLDCETGTPRLGLAQRIAEAMGAPVVAAADLSPAALTTTIRSATPAETGTHP